MQEALLHLADTPSVHACSLLLKTNTSLELQPFGEEQTRRKNQVYAPNHTATQSTKSLSPTQTRSKPQQLGATVTAKQYENWLGSS